MSLRKKLVYRSTLIFLITISLVTIGTYLLYRYETGKSFRKKLLGIAQLAGEFYLEKDEVNAITHKKIERSFNRISDATIRLYKVEDKTIYVSDTLASLPTEKIIERTVKDYTYTFVQGDRVFMSLFYGDNQGDFIIVVSAVDNESRQSMALLARMLIVFACAGLLLHLALTRVLAKKTFLPFNKVISQVNSIKGDDWQKRLNYSSDSNEVNQFVLEFNYLLDRLESSFQVQRNFLKNASHEIKTPLAIIIGDIEVSLNQVRSPEEYKELLVDLRSNSLHLKSIIESLITLSNLEISSTKLLSDVRIDELIWDILDKKRIEYPGREAMVDFLPAVKKQERYLSVQGNKHLLFIAIGNIIDNAFKFSTDSPIHISFDVKNDRLVLKIRDRGNGIPVEEWENVFKLFYRNNKTSHIPGHGIGLYLTKQILDSSHIDITLETPEAGGAMFVLLFPLSAGDSV